MNLPKTPSFRLDRRRALVTGGSRGIGLAAAIGLAEAGAEVTILARSGPEVKKVVDALNKAGLKADGAAIDVTDLAAVQSLVENCAPFQILVNCAGTARHGAFCDVKETDYRAVLDLNLAATLFVSQAVARKLIAAGKAGSIINMSSQMGHVSAPNRAVYSASKHAVEGLTKGMAIELGPRHIRVNTLCPTFIETELTARSLANQSFRAEVLSQIKLGRLGQLEDIMGPVVFLASDAAALITGTSLLVDGGWTAQ